MKTRILLFGGSGYLGSMIKKNYPDILAPSRNKVNLLDISKTITYIQKVKPEVIIYASGFARIDEAQNFPKKAMSINFESPKKISEFCAKENIYFIYISSDAVFDGYKSKFKFDEKNRVNPKSVYGKSKAKGEKAVLHASKTNCVIRLITLWDTNQNSKNFVSKMIKTLRSNKTFPGVYDQINNPLHLNVAVEGISYILKKRLPGIYHIGSRNSISNYDLLVKIAEKKRLDANLIKKISFEEFMTGRIGHRKRKSILDIDKFDKITSKKILKTVEESIN